MERAALAYIQTPEFYFQAGPYDYMTLVKHLTFSDEL